MSTNRVDVRHAVKEVERFMEEPNEGAWIMLKRLVRHLVDHVRLVQVISEQRHVKAPRVDTDSDHAGCVHTRKRTMCAHLFPWRQRDQCVRVLRRSQRGINFVGCQKHDG